MRLTLAVECPVDRSVPEPEFLSVLRVLRRIVQGEVTLEGDDISNGIELTDQGHSVGTMMLE